MGITNLYLFCTENKISFSISKRVLQTNEFDICFESLIGGNPTQKFKSETNL
jgi:hypothetical protein